VAENFKIKKVIFYSPKIVQNILIAENYEIIVTIWQQTDEKFSGVDPIKEI